jgi:hypothetical protein
MKLKGFLLIVISVLSGFINAQHESEGPITYDYSRGQGQSIPMKASNTFDSTFIYTSDTLDLPFFDEFSRNHFQQYSADYSDPGVTSVTEYRLLDNTTSIPLPNDVYYTAQVTFRRVYDIATQTYTDQPFSSTPVLVGDLSAYPVSYATTDLYPPYYIYDTIGQPDVSDTIWIVGPEYFQDSATQFFATLNDANAYWLDNSAYHNYRYGFEPVTLGVVTFDGLDENGYPYSIGSTSSGYADQLTSKPLDLSVYDAADSVYMTFLYQRQGFGDIPEASDSLVLEFYAKDLDEWRWIWSVNGGPVEGFKVVQVKLSYADYFKRGFQFRFRNYGALSGNLDHFNVDYVHLRALSGYQDTLCKDFAFVYPIGSLIKDYTSVPWDHFKNNSTDKMNDQSELVVRNNSNVDENNQDAQIEILYNGTSEATFTLPSTDMSNGNINYVARTTYYSYHDLSGSYIYDITKPGDHVKFDLVGTAAAQFPNYPENDSTFGVQYFANYYSYDDGSAEAAYGPTGAQARLAIQYNAYEVDSLIGVMMHFVPSVNDVSNKLFLLTVWGDNNGQPGAVLYEDEAFFPRQPEYGNSLNHFITYYFKDTMKVEVGQRFYVGWRQFDSDRLNIGLDRNLDNSQHTFYSINNGVNWFTSSIDGSVMIRPIFSTSLDDELIVDEVTSAEVQIYPNPSEGEFNIVCDENIFKGCEVLGIDGRIVLKSDSNRFDLSGQPKGMYLVRINGTSIVKKVILK